MPFKSSKQIGYLKANEPTVFRKWKKKYGLKVVSAAIKSKRGKRKEHAV